MSEYTKSSVTYEQRERRALRWLASFENLIPLVNEPSAYMPMAEIREFVYLDTSIGSPIGSPDGSEFGVTAPRLIDDTPAKACFVPLFESDRSLAKYFQKLDEPTYNESTRSVFIPPCKLGSEWKGILFFHEFRHAFHHINNNFRDTTNPHWTEEVHVFEEEHAIMHEVFPEFTAMLNRGLSALEHIEGDVSLQKILNIINFSDAFPRPQSKKERGLAESATLLALVYQDVNRLTSNKTEQLQRKADFTERYYTRKK